MWQMCLDTQFVEPRVFCVIYRKAKTTKGGIYSKVLNKDSPHHPNDHTDQTRPIDEDIINLMAACLRM